MDSPVLDDAPEQGGKRGHYISTYSGGRFYFDEPEKSAVSIVDIAHALSMQCRFNGHIKRFYSVAEHSVLVSRLVPETDAFAGLMHDASEAYLCDVPRPIKPFLQGYDELEERIQKHLARVFGFEYPLPESVHYIDKHMPATEGRVLFQDTPDWLALYDTVAKPSQIIGYTPAIAKSLFLRRYYELRDK